MFIRKLPVALAAAALTVAPVAAQAAPQRAAAPVAEANELRADLWIFAIIALLVILWAVLDNDDQDNDPVSA